MAEPTVNSGTGTTITFSSGFCAQIKNISRQGMSRPSLKTSHMGTTSRDTFIPGDLVDGGSWNVTLNYNPSTTPPFGAAETITVTFPGGTTSATSGFLTDFGAEIPNEDIMTCTCTMKLSGTETITPGA